MAKKFVLEKSDGTRKPFGSFQLTCFGKHICLFRTPNGDGADFINFLESLKNGERIEIYSVKRAFK